MIPYKSPLLTTVPPTFEKRLEILDAIRTLAAEDEHDRLRRRRAERASVRRDLGELAHAVQELSRACDPRLRSYVIKYNPDQPRVPAGNPDGGQWTSEDTSDSAKRTGDVSDTVDESAAEASDTANDTGESGIPTTRLAAAGDLSCQGFAGGCQSGGSYGATGMYYIGGRVLCMDCADKVLVCRISRLARESAS